MGQGATTGSLVVTLEALKEMHLTPEDIQLIQNDTKTCPDTGMAGASRSLYMDGNATIIAANKLLAAMRKEDGTLRTYDEMKAEGIETSILAVTRPTQLRVCAVWIRIPVSATRLRHSHTA